MPDQIRPEAAQTVTIEKLAGVLDRPRLEAYLKRSDGWTLPPLSHRADLSMFAEKILGNGVAVLAVHLQKTDIGVAAFYCNDRIRRRAYLTHFAVDPQHRCHGIGKALIGYAKEYSSSAGMVVMELEVYGANEIARRFYVSCGFYEKKASGLDPAAPQSIFMVCPLK
jgi:ribosomal protein S18 acetylase RimI-like enzyme